MTAAGVRCTDMYRGNCEEESGRPVVAPTEEAE